MTPEKAQGIDQIKDIHDQMADLTFQYWMQHSHFSTWQFWVNLLLLILPLVILYKYLDWKHALLLGFYGFNIHVWFHYIDSFGVTNGYWNYPHKIVPFLSVNVALDAAIVPVCYMLLYQWITSRNKNYYVYTTLLSGAFAFILKPIMVYAGLFRMYEWVNYFYLFVFYMVIVLVSKWITDLFLFLQERQKNSHPKPDQRPMQTDKEEEQFNIDVILPPKGKFT
ncbi:CBO0543 family protein [Paenibacillus turpanensis]|uniref:CBO0543 family protein n=1 Tax=Paenibacillus turpanensis TaxID=2689078 RepID=UPI001A9E1D9F|nr:CBO0543 family protein [Paenibacillus turpanensis]